VIVARSAAELTPLTGPIAVSVGVFDGAHRGHREVFGALAETAAERGARSVVVTLDPHPATVLRPGTEVPLLTTPDERAMLIGEAVAPDAVFIHPFDEEVAALPPAQFLRGLVPPDARLDALVVGYDFRMGKDRTGGFEELARIGEADGFEVRRVPARELGGAPVSSTRIRGLVSEGRLAEAAQALGHPYLILGSVVPGRGIGRTLDFPTANVDVGDKRKLLPEFGVYAVRARILDDSGPGAFRRDGVMNVGVRPTFGPSAPTLEVHLPGFSGDLQGCRLAVEVVERIRPERQFADAAALAERIAQDVTEARKILRDRN
jgi:riboflavin kinase/FMN adenylyltransferase